jgi:hypothetical protein
VPMMLRALLYFVLLSWLAARERLVRARRP